MWKHFDAWRCRTYLDSFIRPASRQMHELFGGPRWRGAVYFGSTQWTLPYEEFSDPYAVPAFYQKNCPFGRQCGIDFRSLFEDPEITYVLHEYSGGIQNTYSAYWHELRIADDDRDRLGLMNASMAMGTLFDPAMNRSRWEYIRETQPRMLSIYSLEPFFHATDPRDLREAEVFWRRLRAYQESRDPFANEGSTA